MKKTFLCLLLVLASLMLVACGGNSSVSEKKKDSEETKTESKKEENIREILEEISLDGVEVTFGETYDSGIEKSVYVEAQIPNYTELFLKAMSEEDVEKAIAKAVKKKEYSTVEYCGYAKVKVDYSQGTEVVESEELVKSFMEKELVKAINAVLEAEEANQ